MGYSQSSLSLMFYIFIICILIVGILFYLFKALALFKIAKTRGLNNPWMSFVPIVDAFLLGSIADHINHLRKKGSTFRIWLLFINIFAFIINSAVVFYNIFSINSDRFFQDVPFFMWILNVVYVVLYYFALYRIFDDYNESSSSAYLFLSIFFKIEPFLLFYLRNHPSNSIYISQLYQQEYQRAQQNNFQQENQPPQEYEYRYKKSNSPQPPYQQTYQNKQPEQKTNSFQPYKQYKPLFQEPIQSQVVDELQDNIE